MIKSPAELALMQAANDIMLASLRYAADRTREGMVPADVDALIAAAQKKLGAAYDGGLVLIGEASAYPHGSHKPQIVRRGEIVLMDCTCAVHGYQADITRTYVFGAEPTAEQRKLWDQVHRGQQIAIETAKVGLPAGAVDDAVRRTYESWGFGPATACRACRTAPVTASAWRCMSRSISSMAKWRRWRRACASRTSPVSIFRASSGCGSRTAGT